MAQYMLSVHAVAGRPSRPRDAMEKVYRDVGAFNAQLQAAGAWVFAGGLDVPRKATVVRMKRGKLLVTDGPFAEGKEHIGGFWVIRAPDLDSALEWGRRATRACAVPIEVRPLQEEAPE